MSLLSLCTVLVQLTAHVDEITQVGDLLTMLEQCFISAFKGQDTLQLKDPADADSRSRPSPVASLESSEEAKLLAVKAVCQFHQKGAARHFSFFHDPAYHTHAALFIHELLNSLSGNSQRWFRQLQLDCLEACLAVLYGVGRTTVRLCVPGIVSGTARYISRAHLGKDSTTVRLRAIEVLRVSLEIAFSRETEQDPTKEASWIREAVPHLSNVMERILNPATLSRNGYDVATTSSLLRLVVELWTSPGMSEYRDSVLAQQLAVAYMVVANLQHMQRLEEEAGVPVTATVPDEYLSGPAARRALYDSFNRLRGVELLHVATTSARFPALQSTLITTDGDGVAVFLSVMRKCLRLVGTEMTPEDLYTSRAPRRYPAGVVDEFLESVAHALAKAPADSNAPFAGEELTNAFIDECDGVLQNWDLYMLHPPTIYVLTRVILYQFAPPPLKPQTDENSEDGDDVGRFPSPKDFMTSGAFEQLWSVAAPPHLWNITEDEELCNTQQIHHRQVIAATLLRFLSLAASTLMADCVERGGVLGQHCFERFSTLTLYLVMEKAAAPGIVHEAAMHCLSVLSSVWDRTDPLEYFLHEASVVVDEASRAVKVESLREAGVSVLRGAIGYIRGRGLIRRAEGTSDESLGEEGAREESTPLYTSSSQLPALVRLRMSPREVQAQLRRRRVDPAHVGAVADFVSSCVSVASDCCGLAKREMDVEGIKAAVILLRDCFDLTALLNFSTPLEALDEEQERTTTSSHVRVRLLQEACLAALHRILVYCTTSDKAAPFTIQAVVRGLTAFLTTHEATVWAQQQREELAQASAKAKAARAVTRAKHATNSEGTKESRSDDDSEEEAEVAARQPMALKALDWWPAGGSGDGRVDEVTLQLPRGLLKTVYQVYLSFVAILKEPIAALTTSAACPGHRSGPERRRMESVVITPAVFAAIDGLESLALLATDFLQGRMVSDVLPLVLTWYERGTAPRIPTNTEERVKKAAVQFAQFLMKLCPTEYQERVRCQCAPFFTLKELPPSEDRELHGVGGGTAPAGPASMIEEVTDSVHHAGSDVVVLHAAAAAADVSKGDTSRDGSSSTGDGGDNEETVTHS